MAAMSQSAFSEVDVAAEIDDERASLVQTLTLALPLLGWLWLYYSLTRHWSPFESSVPALVLCGAAYGAHRLRVTRLEAACRLMVAGMVVALGAVVYAHPVSSAMAFGVVTVIVANALLGSLDAALSAVAVILLGAAACRLATGALRLTIDQGRVVLCGAPNHDLGYPATAQLAGGTLVTVYYQCPAPSQNTVLMATRWTVG